MVFNTTTNKNKFCWALSLCKQVEIVYIRQHILVLLLNFLYKLLCTFHNKQDINDEKF